MAIKRHKPEEIVAKLGQVEVLVGQGMARIDAIRRISITEQTYYRWRKHYGGMGTDQLKELKRLQKENERLRTAVSDLTLDQVDPGGGRQGKLLSPARRRLCIDLVRDELGVSERRACRVLRVRPETLCRITEFSEHESNGRELDEGERVAVEVLPVLGQSAAAVEPGDGAFDHPTPGLDDEALHPIGSLDDLGLEIGQDAGQGAVKDRPLIGAVGEQFPEKGKQTEQGRQQRETAGAILNVGGGDDAVQQQALRIDQNMPLLALDQLAGIEAVAVDASPPFSALFTL